MTIKPTTFFTLIVVASVALVVYRQPLWLPEYFIGWLGGYRDKQVSSSWLPYYVYAVIAISSIVSIAKFRDRRLPLVEGLLDFTTNGLVKSGYKIIGSLIVVTGYIYFSEGGSAALIGFVLGSYLTVFTLAPIWIGKSLLEMAGRKQSEILMPRGYKVLFYFSALFSLLITVYGAIDQALIS